MKKILLTGSNGFIGKNLKSHLIDKYDLFFPTHAELDLLDSDKVWKFLKDNAFDVVIHAATHDATATSTKDTSLVLENNLKMFFNIAEKRDFFGKMIYFGSGAEFARDHYIPRMKEEYLGKHIPKDQYGFSKYIMAKYTEEINANIYNIRLFAVFGKYEDLRVRFISNNIINVLQNKPISIEQNVFFDYLYIEDLCRICEWFIENMPRHKTYNVCTGSSIDLYSIAKIIKEIMKTNLPIFVKKPGFKKEYSGDNSRVKSEITILPFTNFKKAVKEFALWLMDMSDISVHHYGQLDMEKYVAKGEQYYELGKKKLL